MLIDAGVLVGTVELVEVVGDRSVVVEGDKLLVTGPLIIILHTNEVCTYVLNNSVIFCKDHGARVASDTCFHTGTNNRGFRTKERHALALHVRTHECTVSIIVFEERNKSGSSGGDLIGADLDVVHFCWVNHLVVTTQTCLYSLAQDLTLLVHGCRSRDDDQPFFFVSRQEFDVFRADTIHNLAVWRLNEAELVHASVNSERRDQTDVWSFRRLDRAKATIVRVVNVTYFKAGALTRKTTRSESRGTTLVRDLGERIGLIHELR